jgi:hypothetical protein
MSIEVIKAVIEAKIENPSKKWVLLGLANHAGPGGGNCFPSVRRLMVYGGLSESTVRAKLAELRDEGFIDIVKKSSRHRPTEYLIDVRRLIHLRDPALAELEGTPIYGGPGEESARPPGTGGLSAKTSGNWSLDLREPESRPPGTGPEPSFKPSIKPTVKDQNPLIHALASIQQNHFKASDKSGRLLFSRLFQPVYLDELTDDRVVLKFDGSQDDFEELVGRAGQKLFVDAFVGILGRQVDVVLEGPNG